MDKLIDELVDYLESLCVTVQRGDSHDSQELFVIGEHHTLNVFFSESGEMSYTVSPLVQQLDNTEAIVTDNNGNTTEVPWLLLKRLPPYSELGVRSKVPLKIHEMEDAVIAIQKAVFIYDNPHHWKEYSRV